MSDSTDRNHFQHQIGLIPSDHNIWAGFSPNSSNTTPKTKKQKRPQEHCASMPYPKQQLSRNCHGNSCITTQTVTHNDNLPQIDLHLSTIPSPLSYSVRNLYTFVNWLPIVYEVGFIFLKLLNPLHDNCQSFCLWHLSCVNLEILYLGCNKLYIILLLLCLKNSIWYE